ncbi:MAG TPA: DUF418 domain-containing protein [Croceibacterium sp.]
MNATAAARPEEPDLNLAGGTPDRPVSGDERIVALDFIRGIAVLGILFPNIVAFGNPILAYFWPDGLPGGATAADRGFWLFQFVLMDGKFRGLFTLLFGAGVMLFMERTWARGGTLRLQVRRLIWLALFGLAHYFLLWTGDILFLYAIAGLIALPMLGWEAKTQLRVGLIWYCSGALLFTALLGSQAAIESIPAVQAQDPEAYKQLGRSLAEMIAKAEGESRIMREASFPGIVAWRAIEEGRNLVTQVPFFALVETVPLMLIGMALYRLGLFDRRFDPARMRRWGWIGLIGGLLLSIPLGLWVMAMDFPLMLTQFAFNGPSQFLHLAMVLGLASLLALWAPDASRTWLGSRFVAAGRMAFSNYLGTSLVLAFVFQGWAGGLYGELHRPGLLIVVLAMWLLMLAWSKPWLARFRYGPLEWLWRCLTYGKVVPFRRSPVLD